MVFRRKLGIDFELRVEAANPNYSDFPQENAYFQENLGRKYVEFIRKMHEKTLFFWIIDLEAFWEGLGEGFGKPKSSIFVLFSMFFRSRL